MTAARTSAEAIAQLLGGLAEAVADAQEAMAEIPAADAFGRPLPVYQIPSLDFTFEIEAFETPARPGVLPLLRIAPLTAGRPGGSIQSKISGRIVAVPPNGGLPEARILLAFSDSVLRLQLSNALGERLAGETLELEFDAAASQALHGTSLSAEARLRLLGEQRLTTDADGATRTAVDTSVLSGGRTAVILVRGAGNEARIAVSDEGAR